MRLRTGSDEGQGRLENELIDIKRFHPDLHSVVRIYADQPGDKPLFEVEVLFSLSAGMYKSDVERSQLERIEGLIQSGKSPSEAVTIVFETDAIVSDTKSRVSISRN